MQTKIVRNHCNFTEALPWLRAGSFVMDTAADAQQFPCMISYILHVTITLKNRTDFCSLFFPSVNWWKLRSVSNFEACFEANMLNFMGHKAIYISKCQHCPDLSGCLCRRDDFKVRCCLRDFPWDCLTCRCTAAVQIVTRIYISCGTSSASKPL